MSPLNRLRLSRSVTLTKSREFDKPDVELVNSLRYLIKQKYFSFGGGYYISDHSGNYLLSVAGRAFHIADGLTFYDGAGREVVFVKKQVVSFPITWEIFRDGGYFGFMRQDPLSFVRQAFNLTVPNATYVVARLFPGFKLTVEKDERQVAIASKRLFRLTNTYDVNIADTEDDLLMLVALVTAIRIGNRNS